MRMGLVEGGKEGPRSRGVTTGVGRGGCWLGTRLCCEPCGRPQDDHVLYSWGARWGALGRLNWGMCYSVIVVS